MTPNNETARIFINEQLLEAEGFEKIRHDGFEAFIKDRVIVWEFNGLYWVVDMLDQAGIDKEFRYMDEFEYFFESCGLSFYNPKKQKDDTER